MTKYRVTAAMDEFIVALPSSNTAEVKNAKNDALSVGMLCSHNPDGTIEIAYKGKRYITWFNRIDDRSGEVYVDNCLIPVSVISENIRNAYEILQVKKSKTSAENIKICAPMPGLITKISVKENEEVTPGFRICMLEAMKMENEIRSDVTGVITKVYATEHTAIEKGKPIVGIKLT